MVAVLYREKACKMPQMFEEAWVVALYVFVFGGLAVANVFYYRRRSRMTPE